MHSNQFNSDFNPYLEKYDFAPWSFTNFASHTNPLITESAVAYNQLEEIEIESNPLSDTVSGSGSVECGASCVEVETSHDEEKSYHIYKRNSDKKIIFAIDNDECIGSWEDISILYQMLKIEQRREPDVDLFVDIMINTCCIRPYVKEFFDKLVELKKQGTVYKIFMFTAASNSIGWVFFLCKIIEKWYGQPLYDGIIHREMIEEWHKINKSEYSNDSGYIKNMNMIRELIEFKESSEKQDFHFIAIDDRPSNIVNGFAIGVSAFRVAVNIVEVLRLYLPDKFDYLVSKYSKSINHSWKNYVRNPHIFTNVSADIDFLLSLEHIDKFIFS
jgi:hypothetical protein